MNAQRARELLTGAGLPAPAITPSEDGERINVWSEDKLLGTGRTVDEAMENAREFWADVPRAPRFSAEELDVVRSGIVEATAKSKTMALRIAHALNLYNPNARRI